MYVVSGVSRSGTSLMMECCKEGLGEDRIFGKKFPKKESLKYLDKPYPGEDPDKYALRQYALKC